MSDWYQEIQLQFLEAYQGEPVIWDPNHTDHKDKKKINDAWTRIETEIGKPIKELKTKKDSMMATYRGYCRKIAASIKSGASPDDVYKPIWFAFELMDQFLGPIYTFGTTNNTREASIFEYVECENSLDNNESKTVHGQPDQENLNSSSTSTTRKTIRRRANPIELQDAAKQMKNAFDPLNMVLTKKSDVEDDCDIFGKLIAKKLKKLSENEKADVMFEIAQIFYTKSMDRRSRSYNFSSNSAEELAEQDESDDASQFLAACYFDE